MARDKTRSHTRFRFSVAAVKTGPHLEETPLLPWPIVAVGSGLVAAVIGLAVAFALVTLGWLGLTAVPFATMVTFPVRVWLLALGVAVPIGATVLAVVPLGLTLLVGVVAMLAAQQAYRPPGDPEPTPQRVHRQVVFTVVQVTFGYAVATGIAAAATGADVGRSVAGAVLVVGIAATIGALRRAGLGPSVPSWAIGAGRGGAAALLGLIAVAAVPLATGMIMGEPRISMMEKALGFDTTGTVLWAVSCLLYLPNMLGWSAAWLLAAGFTIGDGTLVAPWVTQLGLLPTVPIFGGLPPAGATNLTGWLALGAVPGVLGGIVVVRVRPTGVVPAVATGALAGLVAGVGYVVWAMLSGGALGVDRFAVVGPRYPEVFIGLGILAVTTVMASMLAWFIDRRAGSAD
jgi:hypothetical protein